MHMTWTTRATCRVLGFVVALPVALSAASATESARFFDSTQNALFKGPVVTGATGLASAATSVDAGRPESKNNPAGPNDRLIINSLNNDVAVSSQAGSVVRFPGSDRPELDAEIQALRKTASGQASAPADGSKRSAATRADLLRLNPAQARASWLMGLLTLHGIGVAANSAAAAAWFERARLQGEPLANAGLAWCDIDGCKTAPNPAAARRWLPALRSVNLPRAQYLQWLVDTRQQPLQAIAPIKGSDLNRSYAAKLASRQLLLSAAKHGDVQANLELGFNSTANSQLAEALEFFRAAAPRSEAAANNAAWVVQRNSAALNPDAKLPNPYVNPYVVAGSDQAATKPGSSSIVLAPSELTSPNETLASAKRNHRGEGQSANFTEAIRLYRLTQSQGNTDSSIEARKMLELIFSRPGPGGQLDVAWMQQLAFVDVSGQVLSLDGIVVQKGLRREQTPLFDLLPERWRKEALHGVSKQPVIR